MDGAVGRSCGERARPEYEGAWVHRAFILPSLSRARVVLVLLHELLRGFCLFAYNMYTDMRL